MFGRIFSATPQEICSRLPEPNRTACVQRMTEMFKEARHERRTGMVERIGGAVLVIGTAILGVYGLKKLLEKVEGTEGLSDQGCKWPLISYGPPGI